MVGIGSHDDSSQLYTGVWSRMWCDDGDLGYPSLAFTRIAREAFRNNPISFERWYAQKRVTLQVCYSLRFIIFQI